MSYNKCLILPVIGHARYREVTSRGLCELGPKNDVGYVEVSGIKCPLQGRFVMRVWSSFHPFLSVRCRGVHYKACPPKRDFTVYINELLI